MELIGQLALGRCPHCNVDKPSLNRHGNHFITSNFRTKNTRYWAVYSCTRCGGCVLAASEREKGPVSERYPSGNVVDSAVPDIARGYLEQANESLHAPAGAIMLAASAVDAMLKERGYSKGNLFKRIKEATRDHLLTQEMSKWAHKVRLDANAQRHADEEISLPTEEEAKKTLDFANALAQFLFVFPALVEEGLKDASKESDEAQGPQNDESEDKPSESEL